MWLAAGVTRALWFTSELDLVAVRCDPGLLPGIASSTVLSGHHSARSDSISCVDGGMHRWGDLGYTETDADRAFGAVKPGSARSPSGFVYAREPQTGLRVSPSTRTVFPNGAVIPAAVQNN